MLPHPTQLHPPPIPQDIFVFVLDFETAHLTPGVRKALFQKGYILVVMAGKLIGYSQANDTHPQGQFKASYRKKVNELMLKKIQAPKPKIQHSVKGKLYGMTLLK